MAKKKTKGKQKIEIKKILKDTDRMITFSKRRSGIYKKINELSTLCGAEIAFLVFSGAGNPFTFGSPSFESVAKRFTGEENQKKCDDSTPLHRGIIDAHKKKRVSELSKQYNSLIDELDNEKERTRALAPVLMGQTLVVAEEEDGWWRTEPTAIEDEQVLVGLITKFEELYDNLCNLMVQRTRGGPSSFH